MSLRKDYAEKYNREDGEDACVPENKRLMEVPAEQPSEEMENASEQGSKHTHNSTEYRSENSYNTSENSASESDPYRKGYDQKHDDKNRRA